jgi:predicted transcriptional regulator
MGHNQPDTWRQRRREIERRARRLVHTAGFLAPPVDPDKVARHLGIAVQRADLGPDCAGVLVRKAETALIGVHWAHHPNRQRFSLAHELGHHQLHTGGRYIDRDTSIRYRRQEPQAEREEHEANWFAGALLMPRGWLRHAFLARPFRAGDEAAIADLAARFQVSPQAMSIRLSSLGWLF